MQEKEETGDAFLVCSMKQVSNCGGALFLFLLILKGLRIFQATSHLAV